MPNPQLFSETLYTSPVSVLVNGFDRICPLLFIISMRKRLRKIAAIKFYLNKVAMNTGEGVGGGGCREFVR